MTNQLEQIADPEFNKNRFIPCGNCIINRNGHLLGMFRTSKKFWLILPNNYYEEEIKKEFPTEHYRFASMMPKYNIFRDRQKVGFALPRVSKTGNNFLFIPNTKDLRRNYYIWDVDESHNIVEDALIYFDISTD